MLIKFTIGNYKIFKEKNTLDLRATSISEHATSHVFEFEKERIVKSAAIYGKNAAGKTKFIDGLAFMKHLIINSSKDMQSNELIDTEPFRLNTGTKNAPSFFEIEFLLNNFKYRYGFEVTKESVEKEWLFERKKSKEYPLFLRLADSFEVNYKKFTEGKNKESWTRKNALFLSLVAQLNGTLAQQIIGWFEKLVFVHHVCACAESGVTKNYLENKEDKALVVQMMKNADLNIEDLEIVRFEDAKVLKTGKKLESPDEHVFIKTYHPLYNEHNEQVGLEDFDLYYEESDGTVRYFDLVGFMIKAMRTGEIIIMDEMDARLHTKLSQAVLMEFNTIKNTNAQFIFTTHNTNLLSNELLRRDQIYFVEKDKYAAAKLSSLAEYKIRKDTNYELNYLKGRYGAIPFINHLFNGKQEQTQPKA
ncbi:MAG: ATP/GTP-binding protein [Saprospiraceae bacterium]